MERGLRYAQWLLSRAVAALGVTAAIVGCHHAMTEDGVVKLDKCQQCWNNLHIDNCADIPKGAIPAPPGTFAVEWQNRHAGKAEADDFVFYYNEWVDGEAVLGPFGGEHLDRIIPRLPYVPYQIIIQPEPEKPQLNARRHQAMIDALTQAGVPNAHLRVVLGRPMAEPMFGDEAEFAYPRLLLGGLGVGGYFGFGGLGNFGFGGFPGFAGGFGGFFGFGGGFGGFFGFR